MTFSSNREFGLRSPSGTCDVDLDAPAGTDSSFAAFAMPFQALATSNHIAQWTTQIVELQ